MMKTFYAAAAIALLMAGPAFAAEKSAKSEAASAEAVMQKADIKVGLSGLVCDFCSIALNKMFKKRDEVSATHVDLDAKALFIVLKADAKLDDSAVTDLVEKAGYNVTGITRAAS